MDQYHTPPAYVSSSSNPPPNPGYLQQLPPPPPPAQTFQTPAPVNHYLHHHCPGLHHHHHHHRPDLYIHRHVHARMDNTPRGQCRGGPYVESVHSSPGSDKSAQMSPFSDISVVSLNMFSSPDPPLPNETQPPEPPSATVMAMACGVGDLVEKLRPCLMHPRNPKLPPYSCLNVYQVKNMVRAHRCVCNCDSVLPLHPETGKCDFKTMCISLIAAHLDIIPDGLELIAALTQLAAEEMEIVFAAKQTTAKTTRLNKYERYQRVLKRNMELTSK